MFGRSLLILAVLTAGAIPVAAATAAQPAPDRAGAEIRVEAPNSADAAPRMTSESELDGSPLGWPLTLGLIVLGVVLLGYVPWRVRRASQARRATA